MFLPVSRLAFRIDLVQLLLLLVVSALVDLGVDWFRYGDDGVFSWFGLGNEIFGAGVLFITAAVLALAYRERARARIAGIAAFRLSAAAGARVAPSMAFDVTPVCGPYWATLVVVMILWVFVLSARSVVLALAPTAPGRWWRAAAGGLLLIAPICFASAIAPIESWWTPSAQSVDPRFPNPASEPVLAAQQHLLDDALSGLDDERPDVTDLYFVGFAGDASEDVFRKDVEAAQRVMDERWGTEGRSLVLVNNPRTLLESPDATVTNLREALDEIAAAMDVDEDVAMVYLASHGNRKHALDVALPPLDLVPITPRRAARLDDAGILRIVIVSACYAGGFVDELADDDTVVIAAAQADRTSFGCGLGSDATFFGEAFFQEGMAKADPCGGVRHRARARRRARAGRRVPAAVESADPDRRSPRSCRSSIAGAARRTAGRRGPGAG